MALWKILRKMGFKHNLTLNDKRYIYKQARIIVQRHGYLRCLRRNRDEHRPVVYLDETRTSIGLMMAYKKKLLMNFIFCWRS